MTPVERFARHLTTLPLPLSLYQAPVTRFNRHLTADARRQDSSTVCSRPEPATSTPDIDDIVVYRESSPRLRGRRWLELLEALGQPTMKAIEAGRAHSRGAAVMASR